MTVSELRWCASFTKAQERTITITCYEKLYFVFGFFNNFSFKRRAAAAAGAAAGGINDSGLANAML